MHPRIACLAAALVLLPRSASAQDVASDPIAIAKEYIEERDYNGAEHLLGAGLAAPGREAEIQFLLGMIAIARNQPRNAIASFRRALIFEPNAIRIRLELARAFYLAHDYENAFRQFQRARAGNPPAPVIAAIDRYMSLIRLEKSWSYNIGFALAPDSNVNSATSSASTEILGLPFQLDEDARRRSGVGVSVEAGGEIAPRIGKRARLRLGAQAQRREYAGQAFDDMSLILQGGPRLILAKWDVSLLGTAYRRWYGGDRLSDGRGGRLELIHYPSGRMQVAAGLFLQKVSYRAIPEQDGMWFGGNVNVLRALSPSSAVIARLGFVRQGAKEAQFANRSASLATGYYRDISGGFSIYVEPAYTTVRYDGRDLLFAKRRSDQIAELTVSLLNRRIVASRFTPRISITRTQRFSNIDLYDFGKTRLEIGLTSDF